MIQLTPAACQEINRLRHRQQQPDAICRLDLQPSSCAQWSYVLSLTQSVDDDDEIYDFTGEVFAHVRLAVNRDRLENIRNLKIDFSENLTGGAFRFDNPLATESCRCGYAFAISTQ
ncbi:MAG: iron-sulfur cluster assembly accessory protein [Phormidesmis sp. RL_2_1]|nr:iron-sulfur cluster assembly accessory protein [Phormidesmis sp. RL_2_1]